MTTNDLLEALARLRVETGSLACIGCGHEHNCSTKGCRVLREAADLIRQLTAENAGMCKEIEWKNMAIALAQRKQAEAEAESDHRLPCVPNPGEPKRDVCFSEKHDFARWVPNRCLPRQDRIF